MRGGRTRDIARETEWQTEKKVCERWYKRGNDRYRRRLK